MTIKFGEWISVNEALPGLECGDVIVLIKQNPDAGGYSAAVGSALHYDIHGGFDDEDIDMPYVRIGLNKDCNNENIWQEAIKLRFHDEKHNASITHWMPLPPLPEELKDD